MQSQGYLSFVVAVVALAVVIESSLASITVQIGGASRLNSLNRQRERYQCKWDCDLVGCQITHDDDECDYECNKVCRVTYDYAATGRSDQAELDGKSGAGETNKLAETEMERMGSPIRLHLPRNASARNFGFWERCSQDAQPDAAKLSEKPMSL